MSVRVNYPRVYYDATTSPTTAEKKSTGYFNGDIWIVGTDTRAWMLVDEDNGAWYQTTIVAAANAGTFNVDGEIAIDTSITDFSHGLIRYYAGEECVVIAVPVAEISSLSDGDILVYKAASDEFQIEQPASTAVPAGTSAWFGSSTPPTGWLEEDGSAVSRTTYADLFAEIGTTWGAGNGTTTFNLPDSRGEFKRGWDNSKGTDSGRTFASFQDENVGAHDHEYYRLGQTNLRQSGNNASGRAGGSTGPYTTATNPTGENLVRNYSWLPIIKY